MSDLWNYTSSIKHDVICTDRRKSTWDMLLNLISNSVHHHQRFFCDQEFSHVSCTTFGEFFMIACCWLHHHFFFLFLRQTCMAVQIALRSAIHIRSQIHFWNSMLVICMCTIFTKCNFNQTQFHNSTKCTMTLRCVFSPRPSSTFPGGHCWTWFAMCGLRAKLHVIHAPCGCSWRLACQVRIEIKTQSFTMNKTCNDEQP